MVARNPYPSSSFKKFGPLVSESVYQKGKILLSKLKPAPILRKTAPLAKITVCHSITVWTHLGDFWTHPLCFILRKSFKWHVKCGILLPLSPSWCLCCFWLPSKPPEKMNGSLNRNKIKIPRTYCTSFKKIKYSLGIFYSQLYIRFEIWNVHKNDS